MAYPALLFKTKWTKMRKWRFIQFTEDDSFCKKTLCVRCGKYLLPADICCLFLPQMLELLFYWFLRRNHLNEIPSFTNDSVEGQYLLRLINRKWMGAQGKLSWGFTLTSKSFYLPVFRQPIKSLRTLVFRLPSAMTNDPYPFCEELWDKFHSKTYTLL